MATTIEELSFIRRLRLNKKEQKMDILLLLLYFIVSLEVNAVCM